MTEITVFDYNDPINPRNYHDMDSGHLRGVPLYWRHDITGEMQSIMRSYLEQRCNANQLRIVIAYLQHFIHAPLWLENIPLGAATEMTAAILAIRQQSMAMTTIEDVNACIDAMMKIALDPL